MTRWLAGLLAAGGVVLYATLPVLAPRVDLPADFGRWQEELPQLTVMLATVGIGAFLGAKRPRNPIGWLLAAGGLGFLAFPVIVVGVASGGAFMRWVAWVGNWVWVPSHATFILCLLLFPEGRPLSPRWRAVVGVAVGVLCALLVVAALYPQMEAAPGLVNPIAVPGVVPLLQPLIAAMLLVELVAVASLVLRFVRSRGVERLQLKWVAYGAVALAVFTVVELVGLGPRWVSALGSGAMVAAIAVAVLRYRLYDIDRLIKRTVVYALLTGLLGSTYLGLVTVLQAVLIGADSQLAVAASTLAAAALFGPLRRRVQDAVDRRFDRRRYDATRTVEAFRSSMRDAVDLDRLTDALVRVTVETVQPQATSVWLRESR